VKISNETDEEEAKRLKKIEDDALAAKRSVSKWNLVILFIYSLSSDALPSWISQSTISGDLTSVGLKHQKLSSSASTSSTFSPANKDVKSSLPATSAATSTDYAAYYKQIAEEAKHQSTFGSLASRGSTSFSTDGLDERKRKRSEFEEDDVKKTRFDSSSNGNAYASPKEDLRREEVFEEEFTEQGGQDENEGEEEEDRIFSGKSGKGW
jgi:hypothetical protein